MEAERSAEKQERGAQGSPRDPKQEGRSHHCIVGISLKESMLQHRFGPAVVFAKRSNEKRTEEGSCRLAEVVRDEMHQPRKEVCQHPSEERRHKPQNKKETRLLDRVLPEIDGGLEETKDPQEKKTQRQSEGGELETSFHPVAPDSSADPAIRTFRGQD